MEAVSQEFPTNPHMLASGQRPGFSLLFTFFCMFAGNETAIAFRPLNWLYFIALATPFFFVSFIALRRRFFPAKLPSRWPEGSHIQSRVGKLANMTLIVGYLCLFLSSVLWLFVGRHDPTYTVPRDAGFFLMSWGIALSVYIQDRKPLRPPAPRRERRTNWGDAMPLDSEYWGQR
jgi:hypothetical protein